MTEIFNGTPHAVKVVDEAGNLIMEIMPSGIIPRCAAVPVAAGTLGGIPLTRTQYGEVEGLPNPEEGVFWIVSALVRTRLPERKDLLSPGQQVRDGEGRIIGCRSFDIN